MERLTIGRLAQKTGLGRETIRYYERRGLISPPPRSASGYRDYPQEAIGVLGFIKGAQALGFTLREVAELQALIGESKAVCGDMRDRALLKLEDIETKIKRLRSIRQSLKKIIKACPGKGPLSECSIVVGLEGADKKS